MCTPFKLVHLCIVADDGPDALVFEPGVLLEVEGEGESSSSSKDSSSLSFGRKEEQVSLSQILLLMS